MEIFASTQADEMAGFEYCSLPDNCIRLVTFTDDGLELTTYDTFHAPNYYALSYVCGDTPVPPLHCINCRDTNRACEGRILVAPNLYEALPYIRNIIHNPIWIDALCLRQDIDDEKERFIPRMSDIYGNARSVLIWLGPHSSNSEYAMSFLQALSAPQRSCALSSEDDMHISIQNIEATKQALVEDKPIFIGSNMHAKMRIPRSGHPMWPALHSLFLRPWTQRIWAVQEAVLSKHALVICGTTTLDWRQFLHLGTRLASTQLLYQGTTVGYDIPHFNAYDAVQKCKGQFLLILFVCRRHLCRRKEDHIYAILSLAEKLIRDSIPVRYSRDEDHYQRLFTLVGRVLISHYDLDLVLSMASSFDKPPGIPSWCPDWALPAKSTPALLGFKADDLLEDWESCRPHPTRWHSLLVSGAQIDTVRHLQDDFKWHSHQGDQCFGVGGTADMRLKWLADCWNLTQRTIGENSTWTAYWETMLGYVKDRMASDFPVMPEIAFRNWRKILANCRDMFPAAMTDPEQVTTMQLEAHFHRLWPGRVFFSTLGGRIGFADRGLERGDMICMFFGTPQLHTLRPRTTPRHEGIEEMEFGSSCYVHGLMMGAACDLAIRSEIREFEIT